MMMSVKNHQTPPTMRPERDLREFHVWIDETALFLTALHFAPYPTSGEKNEEPGATTHPNSQFANNIL
ncbi:hypothetical protein GN956_G8424 [Arapaima gigas]